ncbi:MAG: TrbC/VirB2 family protein [Variovorax sp.]
MNRLSLKLAALGSTLLASTGAFAQATDPFTQMMDAVALDGIAASVIAAGLIIVGIAVAFKSPDVAKRVVKKV